jgi:hypothetical protein
MPSLSFAEGDFRKAVFFSMRLLKVKNEDKKDEQNTAETALEACKTVYDCWQNSRFASRKFNLLTNL